MTDVLIIGGGIAGLTAAAHCADLGQVTVIETERSLGYHASGRSAALYESNYGKPSTTALSRASRAAFEVAGVLSPRGFLLAGRAGEDADFEADAATMALDEITVAQAQEMIPILDATAVTRAAYHADAWDIDTHALMQHFQRRVTQNGGAVHTNCAAMQINRTRQGWEVRTTTQGVIGCKILINAAGAWADQIAQMSRVAPLGVVPHRRSMARVAAPTGHDVSKWPMLFGPSEEWYAKPDAGALIISPADEDPTSPHDAFADDMTLAEGIARYEEYVTTPVTRMLSNWAGLRTFAPDRQLVLGRHVDDPGFVWCAAQGGYGFQTAPAAGQLIADIVAERPSEVGADVAAMVSPARFAA